MKYTQLQAFAKHIRDASPDHLSSLYFILAKESFTREEAVKLLQQKLEGEWKVFDAKKMDVQALHDEHGSYSFFSRKKNILIRDLHEATKATLQVLESFIEKPSSDLTFIFASESCNRATKFYKNAEKQGIILDIPEEKSWEKENSMQQWIVQQVRQEGFQIQPDTVRLMVQQLGTDAASIQQELNKLYAYLGERREITPQDIAAICNVVQQQNIWQLGDALMKRDGASAIEISKALITDGLPFFVLMKQIRTQFQTKFQVCSILTSGGTQADVAAQFPYMKGRILEQNCSLALNYGIPRFRRAMLTLAETELMAKSQSGDDSWLAERLITHLIR